MVFNNTQTLSHNVVSYSFETKLVPAVAMEQRIVVEKNKTKIINPRICTKNI